MNHEELPLTPEELERYLLIESHIDDYNVAITAMKILFLNGLLSANGEQVLLELRAQCREKEIEFEKLPGKD